MRDEESFNDDDDEDKAKREVAWIFSLSTVGAARLYQVFTDTSGPTDGRSDYAYRYFAGKKSEKSLCIYCIHAQHFKYCFLVKKYNAEGAKS